MNILVVGAGAMGTVLAGMLSKNNSTSLWVRRDDAFRELKTSRENQKYLPGYRLSEKVELVNDTPEDLNDWDCLVLAVPTQYLREVLGSFSVSSYKGALINTAKGIELGTGKTPCQILEDIGADSKKLFALSGPSHAEEMSKNQPTSLVLAGEDPEYMKKLLEEFNHPALRFYYSRDRIGVELAGALKNVIAIAAGMSDGMGFEMNTKAAIITRGLAELKKVCVAKGAQADTLNGLSGLGDLITTCCSTYSRNRTFGEAQVKDADSFTQTDHLVEGASTVKSLINDAEDPSIMPLCYAVYLVIYETRNPKEVIGELLSRPLKEED